MIGATLFSGIGAPEAAMPHWRWAWAAENDKFPAAVLAARHPESVNLGDVSDDGFCDRAARVGRPDVLVFGSPCQSFSVAGRRLGLDDPRGNLALIALGIVGRLRPDWFVFENVPGLLSNWSGAPDGPAEAGAEWEGVENSDFAAFLGGVDGLGYSLAWAMLDAQWFGLAQRRERLLAVGHSGDWRGPAAVLFEPVRLCGHSPPRRQAGKAAAGQAADRAGKPGEGDLMPIACGGNHGGRAIAFDLRGRQHGAQIESIGDTAALRAASGGSSRSYVAQEESNVSTQETDSYSILRRVRDEIGEEAFAQWGLGILDSLQSTEILRSELHGREFRQAPSESRPVVDDVSLPRAENGSSRLMREMREAGRERRSPCRRQSSEQFAGEFAAAMSLLPSSGASRADFLLDLRRASEGVRLLQQALYQVQEIRAPASDSKRYAVRRLTPKEAERLQGFPDEWTNIPWRGRNSSPDGPRYKALGNAMAVPVIRWVLSRIEALAAREAAP